MSIWGKHIEVLPAAWFSSPVGLLWKIVALKIHWGTGVIAVLAQHAKLTVLTCTYVYMPYVFSCNFENW